MTMKLGGRVPVESLDEERWTNIERAVVIGATSAATGARVRSSRWGFALAFGAAMLVVILAAGLVGWKARGRAAPVGEVVATQTATPLKIDTSERASSIDIGDATIVSDPATAFVVTRPGTGVLVTMARGKIELDVDKRGDRAPLVVRAGATDVVVIGTRFSVDFGDGSGPVDVRVTEGIVSVVHAAQEVRVTANHQWTTRGGLAAAVPAVATASARTTDAAQATVPDVVATTEHDIDTNPDAPDVLRDRQSIIPDAKLSTHGSGSASRPKATAGGPTLATRPTTAASDKPTGDLKTQIRNMTLLAPLDVGDLHPSDAMGKYASMLMGKDASYALYSRAYLQAMKLGRTSDALTTLDHYIRRFSRNKEYSDALWLRVRILCLQKIDDRCRQAAYTVALRPGTPDAMKHLAELITIQR